MKFTLDLEFGALIRLDVGRPDLQGAFGSGVDFSIWGMLFLGMVFLGIYRNHVWLILTIPGDVRIISKNVIFPHLVEDNIPIDIW